MSSNDKAILQTGFVDLPDEALDVFSHFTQDPGSEVVLVVSQDMDSYAMRMAEILKVPVLDVPNRLSLSSCDLIVVGPRNGLLETIHEMMEGTATRVVSLDELSKEDGSGAESKTSAETPSTKTTQTPSESETIFSAVGDPNDPLLSLGELHPGPEGKPTLEKTLEALPQDPLNIRQPGESHQPIPEDPPEDPDDAETLDIAAVDALFTAIDPRQRSAGEPAGFDPGSLLGEDLREELGSLLLDASGNEVLHRILEMAIRATHTQTGSIMLLDLDQVHLRIAVAKGLPDHVVTAVRQRVGEGVAGTVFATGKPQVLRGRVPREKGRDRGLRPRLREAAVVPILSAGKPMGVLCVNGETDHSALTEESLALLARFSKEVSAAILKAISLGQLTAEHQYDALLRQVERIMSLEESLPNRLKAVAESIRRALGADLAHLFLLDPLGQRLERITDSAGLGSTSSEFVPIDKGMFGWAIRSGKAHALDLWDKTGTSGVTTYLLPIHQDSPCGLLVLENVPIAEAENESQTSLLSLQDMLSHIGDMIEVETNLEAEELLSQMQMRVADHSARFTGLLPHERARAVLEFTVDLLAGETAVWIPAPGAKAVWARPSGPRTATIQAAFRPCLDAVETWVREREAGAIGSGEEGSASDAPPCASPCLGTVVGGGEGCFVLVFAPDDAAGTLAQVPTPILIRVMEQIGALLPEDFVGAGGRAA